MWGGRPRGWVWLAETGFLTRASCGVEVSVALPALTELRTSSLAFGNVTWARLVNARKRTGSRQRKSGGDKIGLHRGQWPAPGWFEPLIETSVNLKSLLTGIRS